MWMLAEGVVLYVVLVKVFTQVNWKYYTGFTLLCYGKDIAIATTCMSDIYIHDMCTYIPQDVLYCTWFCVYLWDWLEEMSGVMEITICKLCFYLW